MMKDLEDSMSHRREPSLRLNPLTFNEIEGKVGLGLKSANEIQFQFAGVCV
ncbi:hypothetical protein HanPSC8_Chr09g0395601 [Helianthus annuus]|nr:hypothetical protein HanPSC8_Chr09g0395601 [Helianthus annuus]